MRQTPVIRSARATRSAAAVARVVLGLAVALAVALGSTLLLAPGTAEAASRPGAARSGVSSMGSSYAADVLRYTNAARAAHGLRPLAMATCTTRIADRWTAHMAARHVFRHQGLRKVLRRCHSHRAAENIAMSTGSFSASDVVRAWMASPGHRANILDSRLRYLGVAAFRSRSGHTYITQDFAG